ncbi:MAG TPA: hypothetical protein VGK19_11465 [Capsulimonadaceae bacterium]|jgi:hypothetical protein
MNKVVRYFALATSACFAFAVGLVASPARSADAPAAPAAAPGVSYEVESGVTAGGATIQDDGAASGGKVVGSFHVGGASAAIAKVDGGKGGSFNLVVRYATPQATTNTLYVNDVKVGAIEYKETGGWFGEGMYKTKTVAITLKPGLVNTIKFQSDDGDGAINMDKITVAPAPPAAKPAPK